MVSTDLRGCENPGLANTHHELNVTNHSLVAGSFFALSPRFCITAVSDSSSRLSKSICESQTKREDGSHGGASRKGSGRTSQAALQQAIEGNKKLLKASLRWKASLLVGS